MPELSWGSTEHIPKGCLRVIFHAGTQEHEGRSRMSQGSKSGPQQGCRVKDEGFARCHHSLAFPQRQSNSLACLCICRDCMRVLWIPGFRGVSTSPGQGNPTAWGKREHKPPESGLVCARAGFLHQPAAEQSEVQPQGEKWPTG